MEEIPPLLDYLRSQPDFAGKEDTFDLCWVGTVPGVERPAFGSLSTAGDAAHRDQILERLAYLETFGIYLDLGSHPGHAVIRGVHRLCDLVLR